ncbi:MAG: type II toxin-antitoxin system ParD family antitoxin [Pirellulaceae bacterium]
MTIELTAEQQAIVESRVKAGLYASPAAMIDKALLVLEENEHRRALQRAFFEREIKPSLDEFDRGEGKPLDMDRICRELNAEWDAAGIPK